MRNVLAGTLVVVALALAGCGGSSTTNSNGSTVPRHSSNGEASKSATQVLADAVKAADSATSLRMNGNVNSGGKKIGLDLSIAKGVGAKGILHVDGTPVGLIVDGNDGYLKAPTAFWEQFGGSSGATIGQLLNGRWLKFPVDTAQFAPIVSFASTNAIFDQLKAGADSKLKNNGVTTFNNQAAIALEDGAKNGTLYVAASGIPYPVALVKKGSDGGTIYFGTWNHPFPLTAPTDFVDLSHLTSSG